MKNDINKECEHGCPWPHQPEHWHYKKPTESWVKELINLSANYANAHYMWSEENGGDSTPELNKVIDFIRSLLSAQKEKLVKEIEGMMLTGKRGYRGKNIGGRGLYNEALKDVLNKLNI